MHCDQCFLRLRFLDLQGSDLVLRRRDALLQMLPHLLRRVAELFANRGEICQFGHHLRIVGAKGALGGLNGRLGGRQLLLQSRENLKIGVGRIVRQVGGAARQSALQCGDLRPGG